MIRGTTPTHTFMLPVDLRTAEVIELYYAQNNTVVVEKQKSDMTVTSNSVSVTLTQEDTLKFCVSDVEMQIRARFPSGEAIATDIKRTNVRRVLKGGVI